MNEAKVALNRWEIRILEAIKSEPRQEKAIAKYIHLDKSIVSELITELMFKGYVQRRRQRRWWMMILPPFQSVEYFSITFEGLVALESARKNNSSLDLLMEVLKEEGQKLLGEILAGMPLFVLFAVKAMYKAARFTLKVIE